MPSHDICQNAKLALEQVRPLKQAFDDSFGSALSSGQTKDIELAQQNKQEFQKKMAEVRMHMHAWEKKFVQTHEPALLASLSRKKDTGEILTKYELFVLYGIYTPTLVDSHLATFRHRRNHEEDLAFMFDEFSHELARSFDEITAETQMYVGKLEPDFFERIPDTLEHVYTSFPHNRVERFSLKIGSKTSEALLDELKQGWVHVSDGAQYMMEHADFQKAIRVEDVSEPDWTKWSLKPVEDTNFVSLSIKSLGFEKKPTFDEICARAETLGFELCSPEVGPCYRLATLHQEQPYVYYIGMRPIISETQQARVFRIFDHTRSEFYDPNGSYYEPESGQHLEDVVVPRPYEWEESYIRFVFRLRKQAHQSISEDRQPKT